MRISAFADEAGKNINDQIAALKRNNLHLIELRSVGKKNVSELSLLEAFFLKRKLNKNGISVWSVGSPLGKVPCNIDVKKYSKTVEHVCKLAKALGTDKIRMFSFFVKGTDEEIAKLEPLVFERLQMMIDVAKKYNVTLCHENEKHIYGDTADRVEKVLNAFPDLKCIYDPANFLQCKQNADVTIEKFGKKIFYMHVKDARIETGAVVPAGYGDGRVKDVLAMLPKDATISVEPHLADFVSYAKIDDTKLVHEFTFNSQAEAFDFAIESAKKLLKENGYAPNENGDYTK